MRTLLAAVALTATAIPTLTPVAEACGGYMPDPAPRMFVISSGVAGTLALIDHEVPNAEQLAWHRVLQTSYDMTEVADAPRAAQARTFTLVGEGKPTIVSSRRAMIVKSTFQNWAPANAFKLDVRRAGPFHLAIEGTHRDATWADLEPVEATAEIRAWVRSPPFSPAPDPEAFIVMHAAGTDYDALTTYTDGKPYTYLRRAGSTWWGGYAGSPRGIVKVDGDTFLVFVEDGIATPIRI